MKQISILSLLVLLFSGSLSAGRITGVIKDDKGQVLPYASISIKGTNKGTTANNEGRYFMVLDSGQYTIICQYVGYTRQEKAITVTSDPIELNFSLRLLQNEMAAVVVKVGAVDPAYSIIKEAIKKRNFYLNQVDRYQSDVYIKGQLRLRDYPNKLFGKKVDFEDGDTSKQKVVYLSETYARLSFKRPSTTKIEVLSTRVSGNSDGFGFSSPQIVNFYNNIVKIGPNPTQRGFVSPIASNALNFYKYKLEGSFIEDGREINKIRVTPKRKYEPLFSGYINIVEDEWRIHSMQLILSKQSQIEFMDTVKIEQLHAPLDKDIWVIKTQVIYPSIKMMGFDAYGNFANVYSKYVINPEFGPKYFNNTVMKFNEGSNKNPSAYWDSIRPIPLQDDEIRDYHVKDSLEQARKDPAYQDSIDRIRNKIGFFDVVFTGITIGKEKRRETYRINPLAKSVGYNTAEGVVINLRGTWFKQLDSTGFNRNLSLTPVLRYGFSNSHLNAYLIGNYNYGTRVKNSLTLSGGKRVYQFNNENPILDLNNILSTLYWEKNHLKNYEAWFGKIAYSKSFPRGLNLFGNAAIQDRMPLNNTTDWKIRDLPDRDYTPNYPEIMLTNITRHQSLTVTVGASWRPGAKYIEFPDRMVYMGSKYPVFTGSITQGVKDLLGSDVDFTKWKFGVSDNLNLKLKGTFSYKFTVGGFLRANSVPVPDYNHFNGNQILTASDYLNSFQLLPYYKYSNTSKFFAEGHVEHHFNGLLTNKIPVFRKLNWHLVVGSNAFMLNQNQYYVEAFAGLENIFKLVRVDLVWGFEPHGRSLAGVRLGIRGLGGRDAD